MFSSFFVRFIDKHEFKLKIALIVRTYTE